MIDSNKNQQFQANLKRMKELQKLLDAINYTMLGETKESKTIYEDIKIKVIDELIELNEAQKEITKEINKEITTTDV